jgi:hypothetical protein
VFERIRADWRRGRALKYVKLGEPFNYTWKTESAGEVFVRVRFDADGDTLVLTIREIGAADPIDSGGRLVKADLGLRELRTILDWVGDMAADLGYTRLRVEGPRSKRPQGHQRFEFDVDRFRRRREAAG